MPSTPSTITLFPFAHDYGDNCLQRATTVNDTLLSAMRAWIVTKKGSRLGNMVGCFLPDIIHDLIDISNVSGIGAQLKTDLIAQFPGVNFLNVSASTDLSNKFVDLIISITFSTAITDITQFELNMTTNISTISLIK